MKAFAINRALLLCAVSIMLAAGCSDSASDPAPAANSDIDSSYLDELAATNEPETTEELDPTLEEEPVEISQNTEDEDRDWQRERGARSSLGRSRDKAKDLANEIQGGTAPEGGVADTYEDEEYASTAGYYWDMPAEWRMAVPVGNRFAEMYIKNQLGNASVSFTKESGSVNDIIRTLSSILVTDSGGRNRPDKTTREVLGLTVTILDMTGTYIDPAGKGSNEAPFYAIHAAIIELPNTRVLINMWGPEDTVAQNADRFNAMISATRKP